MSYTEKKFNRLSQSNKLKKIMFAIKSFFNGNKNLDYILNLIHWYNNGSLDYKLEIFNDEKQLQLLYQKIKQKLEIQYEENINNVFDKTEKVKPTFQIKVILDNIRSPYNCGAIMRTAECFGIEEIIFCGISPNPDKNIKTKRTSMNAQLQYSYAESTSQVIENLKNQNYYIYAIEKTGNSSNINDFDFKYPCALIFGNEEFGIDKDIMNQCHETLHIELFGNKNSLNVSVASGITLYKAINFLKNVQ